MTRRGRRWARWLGLLVGFVVPPLAIGAIGLRALDSRQHPGMLPRLSAGAALPAAPPHDAAKPTVAVLLGADLTEITDALGPYEMFARAGAFNVYAVAPERQPTLLSGGLAILPHLSLSELDARLGAQAPEIVVVPMIPNIASNQNRPLVAWMQRQARAGALMHSWCTGAMALAEAGLLDGLTATAHWGDLPRLAERYPRVRWVSGVRWVDHGKVITSGGLTSGVDASLRVLSNVLGDEVARRVARGLRYPNYHLAGNPAVSPYTIGPADAVLLANAAFRVSREQIGLALYEGVGELDLSNIYDTHSYSAVADVHAVAARPGFVRTAHGLTVMPSLVGTSADTVHARRVRELDRFVVPGLNEHDAAMPVVRAVTALAPAVRPSYPHRDAPERFGLEPIIEDLARTSDRMTAQFALRRLEYRSANITLGGAAFPWAAVPVFLGSALVGVLGAVAIGRLIVNRSRQVRVPIERKALAAEPSRVPHVTAATADGQSGR